MTRTAEIKIEERETRRNVQFIKAIDFALVGTLQTQGVELSGFTVKLDAWECLVTLRATQGNGSTVCHIGADNFISAILKALHMAQNDRLKWKPCKYNKP